MVATQHLEYEDEYDMTWNDSTDIGRGGHCSHHEVHNSPLQSPVPPNKASNEHFTNVQVHLCRTMVTIMRLTPDRVL